MYRPTLDLNKWQLKSELLNVFLYNRTTCSYNYRSKKNSTFSTILFRLFLKCWTRKVRESWIGPGDVDTWRRMGKTGFTERHTTEHPPFIIYKRLSLYFLKLFYVKIFLKYLTVHLTTTRTVPMWPPRPFPFELTITIRFILLTLGKDHTPPGDKELNTRMILYTKIQQGNERFHLSHRSRPR